MRSFVLPTLLSFLTFACSVRTAAAGVSWSAAPFNPAAVPLAVRSPYLSAWLPQGSGTALNAAWPQFWTGATLGWAGFINVDGVSYSFLGAPAVANATFEQAVQKSMTFTSTQSIFVMTAGPVDLTATFLSPVETNDLLKQSLPFAYLALSAAPNDNGTHSVQVYTDISAEWVSGNDSLSVNWTTTVGDIITHQVQLEQQTLFGEVDDRIQQGAGYHSTPATTGTTYQTGEDIVVRAQFIKNGTLLNSQDTNFRAVSDDWPVFALAHDLGSVSSATDPVIYSVGHARDPAISYIIANDALQNRSSFFWSEFATADDAISSFLGDYSNALSRANALDAQIQSDASEISSDYAGLVALSVRQVFGAIETTVSKDASGQYNTSDTMSFLKEISSDGNVDTVDVIFPSWPALLYAYPELGKDLLLPLFEYQATGQYPNPWAAHDMGTTYPKAVGHNDGNDEKMPIEESGNMLIMTLSYTQRTNDTSLVSSYYDLLDQWAQYLLVNTLIPGDQLSTDDFAGPLANQTNLAIKGIVALEAMSKMAAIAGNDSASQNYSMTAASYVQQWQQLAMSSDGKHLTLAYGNDTTWGLTYNMLADKLLGTNLIPNAVYDMQTEWYMTVNNTYGVPLDTRHTYTKSDWQSWTAALVSEASARDMFVDAVYKYAGDGESTAPLSDWYDSISGAVQGNFRARPVVGGHLALLALSVSDNGSSQISAENSTTCPSTAGCSRQSLSSASTSAKRARLVSTALGVVAVLIALAI